MPLSVASSIVRWLGGSKRGLQGDTRSYRFAFGRAKASRTAIINHLVRCYGLERYLEIGTRDRKNVDRVLAETRVGVDPAPRDSTIDYPMTSDEYFEKHPDHRHDLIFIDGLHLYEQVRKDVANALERLSPRGFVVMHDCNPPTEFHQRDVYEVDGQRPAWNGTVWKAWVELRGTRSDLTMHVVDTDWGVGVIRPGGSQQTLDAYRLDYEFLASDRQQVLNLVSVARFLDLHPAP